MLLPALSKAREKARTISCTNNEKSIGIAILLYASENNDYPPLSTGSIEVNGYKVWWQSLAPYMGYKDCAIGRADEPKALQCPARNNYVKRDGVMPPGATYGAGGKEYYRSNYGFHIYCSKDGKGYDGTHQYTHVVNLNQMKRQSENAIVTDIRGVCYPVTSEPLRAYTWDTSWQDGQPNGQVDPRHGSTVNVLFFDGHVQNAKIRTNGTGGYIWDLPRQAGIWPYLGLKDR